MTPEEQRIAIAEACPKLFYGHRGNWFLHSENPRNIYGMPNEVDVLSDLNAMHEAEKVLETPDENNKQWFQYNVWLAKLVEDTSYYVAHATASQRAEAFLRTLNLWKD